MEIPTDCTLHMSILTKYFHRYIPVTMEIVPLLPSIVHGVHYKRVYR